MMSAVVGVQAPRSRLPHGGRSSPSPRTSPKDQPTVPPANPKGTAAVNTTPSAVALQPNHGIAATLRLQRASLGPGGPPPRPLSMGPGEGSLGAALLSRTVDRVLADSLHSGEVDLGGRGLREFPEGAAALHDLVDTFSADLSRNGLTEVSPCVCGWMSLERLALHHNCLRTLPPALAQLSCLAFLNLSHNQLALLPDFLSSLHCLQVLLVSHNRLSSLPPGLSALPCLQHLDASCNEIACLPETLSDVHTLCALNLRRNQLTRLHPGLGRLPRLRSLDVSANQIREIPLSFRHLVSLEELVVADNPLVSPPANICVKGRMHLLAYLSRVARKQERRGQRSGVERSGVEDSDDANGYDVKSPQLNMADSGYSAALDPSLLESASALTDVAEDRTAREQSVEADALSSQDDSDDSAPLTLPDLLTAMPLPASHPMGQGLARDTKQSRNNKVKVAQTARSQPQRAESVSEQRAATADTRKHKQKRVRAALSNQHSASQSCEGLTAHEGLRSASQSCEGLASNDSMDDLSLGSVDAVNQSDLPSTSDPFLIPEPRGHPPAADPNPMLAIRHAPRPLGGEEREGEEVQQLRKVIESLLRVRLPSDLATALSDGVVLCHLANHVRPRCVPRVHVPSSAGRLSTSKSHKNVDSFLRACRTIGVDEDDLVEASVVLEASDVCNVASTVRALILCAAQLHQSSV